MKGHVTTIRIIKGIMLILLSIPGSSRSGEIAGPQDTIVDMSTLPYGPGLTGGQKNQVVTTVYPYGTDWSWEMYSSPKYAHVTGTYLDGFGNPRLEVNLKSTPNFKNTVSFHRYEPASQKVSTAYLPFVHGDTDLQAVYTDIEQKQQGYYTAPPTGVVPNPYPFSQTRIGISTIEQGGIGAEWQLYNASIPRSGHTGKTQTAVIRDTDPQFVRWKLTPTGIAPDTDTVLYDDDRIVRQTFKGPDWVSGKAGTTETFTDQYGKMRLQRSYLNDSTYAQTAYIYDIYNRLRVVVPPGTPYQAINEGDGLFEKYLYAYRYNTIGQLAATKFPQKGWSYTVYDKLDRPVLTQDALQREKGTWAFVKYDKLGRPVISGVYSSVLSQLQLQDSVDASSFFFEERNLSSPTGYTCRTFPVSGLTEYNLSYFDSYDYVPAGNPWATTEENHTRLTMGLPVASKSRILGSSDFLWSTVFYDEHLRPIVQYGQNELGGYAKTVNTYDYAGLLLHSRAEHHTAVDSFAVSSRYEYDHRGRLLKEYVQVDGQTELIRSALIYNELGQVTESRTHSTDGGLNYLQSQLYNYDKRGLPKGVNDIDSTASNRLFAYELLREDAAIPKYDGNITAQKWKTHEASLVGGRIPDSLAYTYDGLDRLTAVHTSSGGIASGDYDERFSYDIRGNITGLTRYAEISGTRTRIDSLQYTYDHNQHTRIDNVAGVPNVGFTELSQADNEYRYNTNGMLATDDNRGIDTIHYNVLGLIDTVVWANGNRLVYTYTGAGARVRKEFSSGANTLTTHYVDGVQYTALNGDSSTFDFAQLQGARLRRNADTLRFEYDLLDHLGNTRVTFDEDPLNPGQARILQYNSYYAFGGTMPGSGLEFVSGQKNKYLYNGKELQEETGLYDYGPRMYDGQTGRWNAQDILAAQFYGHSPYSYVVNNPLRYADPTGMAPQEGSIEWVRQWRDNPMNHLMGYTDPTAEEAYFNQMEDRADWFLNDLPAIFEKSDREYENWRRGQDQQMWRMAQYLESHMDYAGSDYLLVVNGYFDSKPTFKQVLDNYPLPYSVRPDRTPRNSDVAVDDSDGSTFMYEDQCAIRLSIALIKAGVDLSGVKNRTNPGGQTFANGNVLGAKNLALFLKNSNFGKPEEYNGTVDQVRYKVEDRQGIMYFERFKAESPDGRGSRNNMYHIDLWNKSNFIGISRNNETMSRFFDAEVIWFWNLK